MEELGAVATTSGTIGAAIANTATRLYKQYTGRGPTRARTVLDGDLVTVVLGDALTIAEQRLIVAGRVELVEQLRREFHATMREDLVSAVEMLTQRSVVAFLSAHNVDPDITVHSFVLRRDSANGHGPIGL